MIDQHEITIRIIHIPFIAIIKLMKTSIVIDLILSLFLLLLFSNCSNKKHQLKFDIYEPLNYSIIDYPDILGLTMDIIKKNNYLFINDFRGDTLIHAYDLITNKICKIIPVGNGPNELISPLRISLDQNKLNILSKNTAKLYTIPFDSLANGYKNLTLSIELENQIACDLCYLKDSTYIVTGFFEKRYATVDNMGNILSEFGDYPSYWDKEKDFPYQAKAMFHQTSFAKHPIKPLLVTYSNCILEIYDYSVNYKYPRLIKNLLINEYNYNYINDGTILSADKGPDVARGIMALAATTEYIYVVYNPNIKNRGIIEDIELQIIDWEGNPIKAFTLDKNVSCLTIDEKENKGYAIIQDPNDTLITFEL